MRSRAIGFGLICAAFLMTSCSREEITDNMKTMGDAVVSGANSVVSEVNDMITEASQIVTSESEVSEEISESEAVTTESTQYIRKIEPDLLEIRHICQLATVKCEYNNVVKGTKLPGTGWSHNGEKERKFWIEYKGYVEIGVEMSDVVFSMEDNNIVITMPKAKVLGVHEKITQENGYTIVTDNDQYFQKNPVTMEDASRAVERAQDEIWVKYKNDSSICNLAQQRAKRYIQNYIDKISCQTGTEYNIKWEYQE